MGTNTPFRLQPSLCSHFPDFSSSDALHPSPGHGPFRPFLALRRVCHFVFLEDFGFWKGVFCPHELNYLNSDPRSLSVSHFGVTACLGRVFLLDRAFLKIYKTRSLLVVMIEVLFFLKKSFGLLLVIASSSFRSFFLRKKSSTSSS